MSGGDDVDDTAPTCGGERLKLRDRDVEVVEDEVVPHRARVLREHQPVDQLDLRLGDPLETVGRRHERRMAKVDEDVLVDERGSEHPRLDRPEHGHHLAGRPVHVQGTAVPSPRAPSWRRSPASSNLPVLHDEPTPYPYISCAANVILRPVAATPAYSPRCVAEHAAPSGHEFAGGDGRLDLDVVIRKRL